MSAETGPTIPLELKDLALDEPFPSGMHVRGVEVFAHEEGLTYAIDLGRPGDLPSPEYGRSLHDAAYSAILGFLARQGKPKKRLSKKDVAQFVLPLADKAAEILVLAAGERGEK